MNSILKKVYIVSVVLIVSACTGMPDNVKPVKDFDLQRYLGKWYEIARLDHSFERGLSQVSATYSLRDDGGVSVLNRGFNSEEQKWEEAQGKAYFVQNSNLGYLKVSFFGPFYGSYIIFELEHEGYEYAFVSGPNLDYLWLLARTPTVQPEVIKTFLQMAEARDFDTKQLIFVKH
ncbi:lipocalin [Psychromonas sp. psych-6C06]|uniref:lipocalin family protein n=1 Tax=Psychromonas sp. psych-6C06 TaxID=2058089 RepID=UPI000C32005F|nr:lipocalin family protein [Psychromonas sp. psych-6C06]PKF60993.1 lipocalin [Psychromonas sp. psych-6C06]